MTTRDEIINNYFEWLYDMVNGGKYAKAVSYRKLLMCLHDIEFTWTIPKDANRAEDGEYLRYRYSVDRGYSHVPDCLDVPCSVLEMMVALAIHCEENIMDDPSIGNRTGQWFWEMIRSLGLSSMIDSRFDKRFVEGIIYRFLDREYDADGRGGLFTIKDCDSDVRTVEIWYQLCWYLNSIM